jgi:hypothetical protein
MSNINNLTYEVWYQYRENTPRKLAAFHFRFEAEKYITLFHPNDAQYYYIIDSVTKERF